MIESEFKAYLTKILFLIAYDKKLNEKKRHSIIAAMMLCINLGATSYSNMDNRANSNSSTLGVQFLYSSMMLGIMVFVTSPLNDAADVVGDKVTGRKTIPIVIGSENSIKLGIIFAGAMIVLS